MQSSQTQSRPGTQSLLFSCFIPGRPIVKKNNKRIIRAGGKQRILSSQKFQSWETKALITIRQAMVQQGHHAPLIIPLHMKATFKFKNGRSEPDLSNLYEGIQDALQSAGVIRDDKLIQSHDGSRKVIGGEEGLLVEIYEFVS